MLHFALAAPQAVTQLTTLLSSAGGWISGLGVVGGGTMLGYHALSRNLNDDPQQVAHHTASMKKVLVGTAIIVAAGGLAHFVAGAF